MKQSIAAALSSGPGARAAEERHKFDVMKQNSPRKLVKPAVASSFTAAAAGEGGAAGSNANAAPSAVPSSTLTLGQTKNLLLSDTLLIDNDYDLPVFDILSSVKDTYMVSANTAAGDQPHTTATAAAVNGGSSNGRRKNRSLLDVSVELPNEDYSSEAVILHTPMNTQQLHPFSGAAGGGAAGATGPGSSGRGSSNDRAKRHRLRHFSRPAVAPPAPLDQVLRASGIATNDHNLQDEEGDIDLQEGVPVRRRVGGPRGGAAAFAEGRRREDMYLPARDLEEQMARQREEQREWGLPSTAGQVLHPHRNQPVMAAGGRPASASASGGLVVVPNVSRVKVDPPGAEAPIIVGSAAHGSHPTLI